jgi:hypothetical protein
VPIIQPLHNNTQPVVFAHYSIILSQPASNR